MKYYYPLGNDVDIKVYKYINPDNPDLNEYWMTTTNPNDKTILTESFDSKFNLYNTFLEEINSEEANLLKYVEYEGDVFVKEINANIIEDKVFTSNQIDPYNYKVEYTNRFGRLSFEKQRQFQEFCEIVAGGKKYQTAKFNDEYFINAIDQQDKYDFTQTTYYSKGIGMVKYERQIPTGEVRILELQKILSVNEFDSLKKDAGY